MKHLLPSQVGFERRLSRLFNGRSGNTIFVPLDDLLIAGAPETSHSLGQILDEISDAVPEAIIGFPGILSDLPVSANSPSLILNLTASTKNSGHVRKVPVFDVSVASQLDCDAVAFHINVSSKYEGEMLHEASQVIGKAHGVGIPVLGMIYPRKEGYPEDRDDNYESLRTGDIDEYVRLIEHCIYIAVELGADIIKTRYVDGKRHMARFVAAARGRPLVFAGGSKASIEAVLQMAYGIVESGGNGVSFGRNVVSAPSPKAMIRALQHIVHDRGSVQSALDLYGEMEHARTEA